MPLPTLLTYKFETLPPTKQDSTKGPTCPGLLCFSYTNILIEEAAHERRSSDSEHEVGSTAAVVLRVSSQQTSEGDAPEPQAAP